MHCATIKITVKKNLNVQLTQSDFTPSWKQGELHVHLQFAAHYTGAVVNTSNMDS